MNVHHLELFYYVVRHRGIPGTLARLVDRRAHQSCQPDWM